jgi:multiple sugar transport system ATP-binding protein
VVFGQFSVPLDSRRRPSAAPGSRVVLGIRPEAFEDADLAGTGLPTIDVHVEVAEELGSDAHLLFPVEAPPVTAELLEAAEADQAGLLATESALFTARVDARTSARPAATVRLAVDPGRFHFFDPESGASLQAQAPLEAVATAS